MPKHLVVEGLQFRLPGQDFDPTRPFTYCRLCGAVYQTAQSRSNDPQDQIESADIRRRWSYSHIALRHTQKELDALEKSGLYMTADAQRVLAPLGVVAISDFPKSKEHHEAGLSADRYREDLV